MTTQPAVNGFFGLNTLKTILNHWMDVNASRKEQEAKRGRNHRLRINTSAEPRRARVATGTMWRRGRVCTVCPSFKPRKHRHMRPLLYIDSYRPASSRSFRRWFVAFRTCEVTGSIWCLPVLLSVSFLVLRLSSGGEVGGNSIASGARSRGPGLTTLLIELVWYQSFCSTVACGQWMVIVSEWWVCDCCLFKCVCF